MIFARFNVFTTGFAGQEQTAEVQRELEVPYTPGTRRHDANT